ncbi:UNVERIFIED_CONTAM: hypothetical protein RMT77_005084 [Armadillidium vulgare]
MPSASNNIQLWVRPEVLELGVLPILPPEKISIEILSRLLQHCQDLGDLGYPKLGYHIWKHIAVKKIGLSSECAMVVFYSCLLFSQQQPEEIKNLETDLAAAASQTQRDDILGEIEVVTLELVLLLYLHRLNTTHPRAQACQASFQTLTTDPWPGSNQLTSSPKRQLLEEQYSNFIKDSLPEILSLLAGHLWQDECDRKKGEKRSAKDLLCFMKSAGVLSPDVVQALGFILGAFTCTERTEKNLLTLATDKHHCYQSGYLSKKKSFQKGLFEQWVLRCLDWAPHGEWLCIRRGRRLNWPVVSLASQSFHRFITSPTPSSTKLLLLSELSDGITVQMGDGQNIPDLKIRRCSKSVIYILHPLRHVVVHKCHDSRIILGPVCGRVKISECKNTVVICPSRSVVISECRAVTVHTLCPQRPLLVGVRTQGVTLAPLCFHYPKLLQHLNATSLHTNFNLWNRPLHLGSKGIVNGTSEILSPEDFTLFPMPFSDNPASPVDGRPPLLPPGLPHEFVKSVEANRQNVSSLRNEIKEAGLSQEQRILLQKTIDARFKVWLKESGKQRELDQLERLDTLLKYQRVSKTTAI